MYTSAHGFKSLKFALVSKTITDLQKVFIDLLQKTSLWGVPLQLFFKPYILTYFFLNFSVQSGYDLFNVHSYWSWNQTTAEIELPLEFCFSLFSRIAKKWVRPKLL